MIRENNLNILQEIVEKSKKKYNISSDESDDTTKKETVIE